MGNARDPLWCVWAISLLANAAVALAVLAGVADFSDVLISAGRNGSFLLFFASLLLSSIRGKSLGTKELMSLEARFAWGAISVVGLLAVLGPAGFGLIP